MDWLRNELKDAYKAYLNNEHNWPEKWYGWYQLREDWKGELHILKMMMNWCDKVPDWVYKED
jgi:hypothetical protein